MSDERDQSQDLSPLKRALFAIKDLKAKLGAVERARVEPIAIVGMACRFPGAPDLDSFWKLLDGNVDAIRDVPRDRWDVDAYYDPDPDAPGKCYARQGGFIDEIDRFDANFFGIPPREVNAMDPQQRLLLEVTWEALENAGVPPSSLVGTSTGVFVGLGTSDFSQGTLQTNELDRIDAYIGTGSAACVAAGRISYVLGLQGPAMAIDTACSSSLVAVDVAVQQLRTGRCDLALAGGVNVILSPTTAVYLAKVRALSPTNRCRAFDAAADGYVRGEGCGIVVLKRLSDAERGGDMILAIVRGSATNHDGRSSGLTVPNGQAQRNVVRAALTNAGLEPSRVHYVETHGTGTPLGDPIELRALGEVLGEGREHTQPVLIGTVKTNIGHLEAAAGVAGLIKVVLAMQHGRLPASLHFHEPNPHIPWDEFPVRVVDRNSPWPLHGTPVAGVSAFGFSGTNAHVIVEAAPQPAAEQPGDGARPSERPEHVLALSAVGEPALRALAGRYAQLLDTENAPSAADVAFSANTGRSAFSQRLTIVGQDGRALAHALDAFGKGREHPSLISGQASAHRQKIGFLFTGQGSQYAGMGRELYDTEPRFRESMDLCDTILGDVLQKRLLAVIYPSGGSDASSLIDQTAYTQPALFALEYSLAQLWRSWGIEPAYVMGHSLGEYVAACVAGLFSLEDGLRLIAERARLMQSLPEGGRMAAVFAPEPVVAEAIGESADLLSIAAINGPEHVVISGAREALEAVVSALSSRGVGSQNLLVSHAFHSPLMEPILDEFERAVARVSASSPRVRLVSNLTGGIAAATAISQPSYWRQHLRAPVRFAASLDTLVANDCRWLLEIGPHPTLLGMAARCLPEGSVLSLPSLRKGTSDTRQMLRSLGTMYTQGVDIDWQAFDRDRHRRRVSLPNYPFQRSRHWPEPSRVRKLAPSAPTDSAQHPLLGERVRSPLLKEHVYQVGVPSPSLRFLEDHVIYGTVVFPATAYVEMAAAGGRALFSTDAVELDVLALEEPLTITEETARIVQVAFAREEDRATFQVFSRSASADEFEAVWTRHATGSVAVSRDSSGPTVEALPDIQSRCDRGVDVAQLYEQMRANGVEYGPTFRGISELWRGADEALGRLQLPTALAGESNDFAIHPAFLDAALQVLGATVGDAPEDDVFLPIGISQVRYHRAAPPAVWSHARLFRDPANPETLRADLRWIDDDGQLVWEASGVTMKRASRQALQRASDRRTDEWLYEVEWQVAPVSDETNVPAPGTWLLLADDGGVGERLATELRARGGSPVLAHPGNAFGCTAEGYRLDPTRPDHLEKLLDEVASETPLAGIVHLWGLDARNEALDVERIDAVMARNCGSVLLLVQRLAARATGSPSPRLSLVTRGAAAVGLAPWPIAVAQTPVLGLARTIALEQPQLQCVTIDLDPADDPEAAAQLAAAIVGRSDENQLAFRGGSRFVARLVRNRLGQTVDRRLIPSGSDGFQLTTTARGVLDNLCFVARARTAPGPGEVEVRVHAAGVNFRDVLNALGMYPGDPGPMGGECAGRVAAVGPGVTDLEVGDEVVCLAGGSFSRYVVTPREAVVALPANLSYEQGAAIPVTFLTAYYGLHHLARIKKGDRVLVHAAAGGVGQAAVQIALRAGAEVYATAGSSEKRDFVRQLGVRDVFSSRTADFASELMSQTGGYGVDIVLNSLTGAFIPESLKVLAKGGHFLEIGKAEIWTHDAVAAINPAVTYRPFDLTDVMLHERGTIASMFDEVMKGLADESLRPLPTRIFDIRDALPAFRFMAQARHVGKIVLSQREMIAEESEGGLGIDRQATYLVTGGTGGLGLKVAEWLVARNARHLVLMSRSGPSPEARRVIDGLTAAGAVVTVALGNISSEADLRRILDGVEATPYPLRGIVHAAGVSTTGC